MTDSTKAALAAAFKTSVRTHAAAAGNVKWGEAESNGVICDMIDALLAEPDGPDEGSDAIAGFVAKVVNPSAFAQFLEKLPATGFDASGQPLAGGTFGHPSRIVRPKRGTGGARGTVEV